MGLGLLPNRVFEYDIQAFAYAKSDARPARPIRFADEMASVNIPFTSSWFVD